MIVLRNHTITCVRHGTGYIWETRLGFVWVPDCYSYYYYTGPALANTYKTVSRHSPSDVSHLQLSSATFIGNAACSSNAPTSARGSSCASPSCTLCTCLLVHEKEETSHFDSIVPTQCDTAHECNPRAPHFWRALSPSCALLHLARAPHPRPEKGRYGGRPDEAEATLWA